MARKNGKTFLLACFISKVSGLTVIVACEGGKQAYLYNKTLIRVGDRGGTFASCYNLTT